MTGHLDPGALNDPPDPEEDELDYSEDVLDLPRQSTTVVDSDRLGVCVDCGEATATHMRRCQWCAALKHLA